MVNEKLYICRECGYVFPKELSELIKNRVQVYCEMCGTPFSLEGVIFKQPEVKFKKSPIPKRPTRLITDRRKSKLSETIKAFNKFAYIPVLIFSAIFIGFLFQIFIDPINWINILITHLSLGIAGILIVIYDVHYISPKIENEEYDEILLDAFCYGILGCIIFGVGVFLLIKGILIIIYGILNPKQKSNKVYNFGLNLKNSLNEFSAKAGTVIVFFVLYRFSIQDFNIGIINTIITFIYQRISTLDQSSISLIISIILIVYFLIPILILIVDVKRKGKIREKNIFSLKEAISTFILGLIGTIFFAIGIFILLKGILMFILVAGKPSDFPEIQEPLEIKKAEERKYKTEEPIVKTLPKEVEIKLEKEKIDLTKESKEILVKEEKVKKEKKETPKLIEREKAEVEQKHIEIEPILKEQESEREELRLHDSLLPVKDERDKKIVKEYFTRIFTLISKDIRNQIMKLNIPKKEKKEILKELAFLTEQEQIKYIEALSDLYKELPRKLIIRIRKLPNVKPQHYDKIIEQLKYMDAKEQINFIEFLEKNA